jgi:hypothetical protein
MTTNVSDHSESLELDRASTDPFLAALAAVEYDDEPYTDNQRAAAREGREAFQRGEYSALEAVQRELLEEDKRESS